MADDISSSRLPALDLETVDVWTGSTYPETFAAECAERQKRALGDAAGLKNFGVNLVRMAPGVWSSQRHCHSAQDEFVYILEGEVVLITDIDMLARQFGGVRKFVRKDGTAY
ncbi:MAG TPA: cupin domain-containing protein [Rhodospirillales bacterium]|nr:cupin domain-containing protein [Rhodospirillales bacterium]